MSSTTAPVVVTAGEPAGIGPDLCLALAADDQPPLVIGDVRVLRARAALLGVDVDIRPTDGDDRPSPAGPGTLHVIDLPVARPVRPGAVDPANAQAVVDGIALAVDGCRDGRFSALVTAPVQKSVINDAGIAFSGHTEFIAGRCGAVQPVMLLVAGALRVALATTHLPLREVADAVTPGRLRAVIDELHRGLQQRFGIENPQIIVCGLNPHAGEGGHLGSEDGAIIAPAVAAARADGIDVRGPVPADTAFTPAAGRADAILAMYHDQGLPVIKHVGFGRAVNVTLGVPIVRTSVDHGTALDLAGSGRADAGSLHAALRLARELAN